MTIYTEISGMKDFLSGSAVKNLPANAGDVGLIPGSGRPPGGGHANPLQYFCLEKPVDRGVWRGCRRWGRKDSDMTEHATRGSFCPLRQKSSLYETTSLAKPQFTNGEGNGTPLQYSCLENPMDRGAW